MHHANAWPAAVMDARAASRRGLAHAPRWRCCENGRCLVWSSRSCLLASKSVVPGETGCGGSVAGVTGVDVAIPTVTVARSIGRTVGAKAAVR